MIINDNIPKELKGLTQWVSRVDKVPISPITLYGAKPDDSESFGTLEQAIQCIGQAVKSPKNVAGKKCNGIGFELKAPYCGIDIDHCINSATGEISKEALDIIKIMDSYTEISPSGTGIHIIYKNNGSLYEQRKKKSPIDNIQKIEMYQQLRFLTVTGNVVGKANTIQLRDNEAKRIYKEYYEMADTPNNNQGKQGNFIMSNYTTYSKVLSENEIIEKARNAKNGREFTELWNGNTSSYGDDKSRADLALCNILAFWSGNNADTIDTLFRQSGLIREKWDRKTSNSTYGKITIDKAISNCTQIYETTNNKITGVTQSVETNSYPHIPVWVYEDKGELKIDEKKYITEFIKKYGVKCINEQLYTVDGFLNDNKAKQTIIKEILSYIKSNHGDKAEKLLKSIKSLCYCDQTKPSVDKLHFLNGTLSKDKDGLFTVWSKEKEFCINRINTNYNPSAKNPQLFYNYLKNVYYEDDIKTIQQYCGYCLLPTTLLQKSLFIIGDGGEGKSVLGIILNAILGSMNCYNDSINTIAKPFGIANIENKLLFIDDDLSENALKDTRQFKNLVSNKNDIQADKKFVQNNIITSYVRFLVFGNFTLQSLYDSSEGFFRRQLVLRAKAKDKNRVDNLTLDKDIIDNEVEGVLLWIIQGLNDLLASNYNIYISERTKAESDRIKRESDSVLCFLEECTDITIGEGKQVYGVDLYNLYSIYCDDNALFKLSQKSFIASLKLKGKSHNILYSSNIRIENIRRRGFTGIGINSKSNYISKDYTP